MSTYVENKHTPIGYLLKAEDSHYCTGFLQALHMLSRKQFQAVSVPLLVKILTLSNST